MKANGKHLAKEATKGAIRKLHDAILHSACPASSEAFTLRRFRRLEP